MDRFSGEDKDTDDLEIELAGGLYPLRVRRLGQARSISVSADTVKQEVRLTLPRYANIRQALHFAESKSDWLAARFAEAQPIVPIEDGVSLSFLGAEHKVSWSPRYPRTPERIEGEIRVGGPEDRLEDRLLRWMKGEARQTYAEDLEYYCARAETELPNLSVGDARRRWGSCSGKRSIRLNWRLIMAPPMVRKSVVAHEVAHLRHMNHSASFYDHLDQIFEGNRREADRWLKQHGGNLHLIGASQRA